MSRRSKRAAIPAIRHVLCISDLHLGARNCEAKHLRHFLEDLAKGRPVLPEIIVLNGDIFERPNVGHLKKRHLRVIEAIKKLSKVTRVIAIVGNHDPDADVLGEMLGVEVIETLIVEVGGRRLFFSHGHQHDEFIYKHPIMTAIADGFYNLTQMVDPSHKFARSLKRRSKKFLKAARKIGLGCATAALNVGCDVSIHGHNHHAGHGVIDGVDVYDDGCWTEKPCTYLLVTDGKCEIFEYHRLRTD